MPYLVASELVLSLPKAAGSITASSTPISIDEVATQIARVSVALDAAAAAAGYAVPIPTTATAAYAQMQEYTSLGVGWKVLRAIFPGGAGGPGDRLAVADDYEKAYTDALVALRKGDLPLVNAPVDTGGEGRALPRSFDTTNILSPGSGASPVIQSLDIVF